MVRCHYNQQARLKEFAENEGNKFRITMVDLERRMVGWRNIESAFYEKDLYSDELERELNAKVESPGMKIFDKVYKSRRRVNLRREEVEMMKKYLLIQNYRNPNNISHYSPDWEGDVLGFNKVFENGDETYKDYVYRMMSEILDNPWSELINSKEKEVSNNVLLMNMKSTLFVRSAEDFVINDIGSVTERHEWHYTDDLWGHVREEMRNIVHENGNESSADKIDTFISSHQYHDNYIFYPISSNFGVIAVDGLWTALLKNGKSFDDIRYDLGLYSEFLRKYFRFCENRYCNPVLRRGRCTQEDICRYASPDDRYIYPVMELDSVDSWYLNSLTINEANRYIGFRNFDSVWKSIEFYNCLSTNYRCNVDISWVRKELDWKSPLI